MITLLTRRTPILLLKTLHMGLIGWLFPKFMLYQRIRGIFRLDIMFVIDNIYFFLKDKEVATTRDHSYGLICSWAGGDQELRVSLPETAILNKDLRRCLCVSQSLSNG